MSNDDIATRGNKKSLLKSFPREPRDTSFPVLTTERTIKLYNSSIPPFSLFVHTQTHRYVCASFIRNIPSFHPHALYIFPFALVFADHVRALLGGLFDKGSPVLTINHLLLINRESGCSSSPRVSCRCRHLQPSQPSRTHWNSPCGSLYASRRNGRVFTPTQ